MRLIFLLFFGLIVIRTSGQGFETLDSVEWGDRMNPRSKDFKTFTIDKIKDYNIKDEGKVLPGLEGDFVVIADLIVNGDTSSILMESEALLRHDTLNILIHRLDSSNDHNFQIQIVKDKCFVFYDYSHPMDEQNRKLRTIDFTLTLNSSKFAKGDKIRGHVTYRGQCTSYCDDWLPKEFKIDGDFVITIR